MPIPEPDHITENGVNVPVVLDSYPEAAGEPEARIASVLRRAERLVRDLAPPPEEADSEYPPVAADAELAVWSYLWSTEPHLEREQTLDKTHVYRGDEGLQQLVKQSMGSYYVGPRVVPPNNDPPAPRSRLTNVSPDPLW